MRKQWLSATAAVVLVLAVGAAVSAAQINGVFDPNSTSDDLAFDVGNNWDGQDFDCEREGSTIIAFWDGMPAGERFQFDEGNPCLGRKVYLTFVADDPAMPAHPYELQLDCEDNPTEGLLMSAQFALDGDPVQYLTDGANDFGDVSIVAMGLTTDSSGFGIANDQVPATTPMGKVIALVATALLLGFVVLRRIS